MISFSGHLIFGVCPFHFRIIDTNKFIKFDILLTTNFIHLTLSKVVDEVSINIYLNHNPITFISIRKLCKKFYQIISFQFLSAYASPSYQLLKI